MNNEDLWVKLTKLGVLPERKLIDDGPDSTPHFDFWQGGRRDMNNRDREAWAQKIAQTLPPHPTGESSLIVMPGPLPSKANRYEVRFAPGFWRQIEILAQNWKKVHKSSPYWIGPSALVESYEEHLAWMIKQAEPFRFDGPLELTICLNGQKLDVDNIKVIPDAIERSGVIKNDNQFTRLVVDRIPNTKEPSVLLTIKQRKEAA